MAVYDSTRFDPLYQGNRQLARCLGWALLSNPKIDLCFWNPVTCSSARGGFENCCFEPLLICKARAVICEARSDLKRIDDPVVWVE